MIYIFAAIGFFALVLGVGYLAGYLSMKIKNEKIELMLRLINEASYNAVMTVGETFVKELKAARSDGKLTVDEAKEAFNKAKAMIIDVIGPKIKKLAQQVGIELETLIHTSIEKWVMELKKKWMR